MWMNLSEPALSIVGAIIAGAVIGLEREWRGRAAGLRTHILVSLSSALLMLAAMAQVDWAFRALPDENIVTDPTRMAHGILTGIGFLCAGVIFRTGFTVHGLTTAASLWITSAIGVLFGAGLYGLGTTATITTALILIGLRAINARMTSRTYVDVEVRWGRDGTASEIAVEAGVKAIDPTARPGVFVLVDDGTVLRRTWRVQSTGEVDMKALAERLQGVDGLIGYRLVPRDD